MVGQANFSAGVLHAKGCNRIQKMLFKEKWINFNDLPVAQQRGVCLEKREVNGRNRWTLGMNIPIFTQDRDYIEKHV